jgi:hypothetical protein
VDAGLEIKGDHGKTAMSDAAEGALRSGSQCPIRNNTQIHEKYASSTNSFLKIERSTLSINN